MTQDREERKAPFIDIMTTVFPVVSLDHSDAGQAGFGTLINPDKESKE